MADRPVFREDHALFREQVLRFIDAQIAPGYAQWERDGITPRALWRAAGEAGLLNCQLPEPYGMGGDYGFGWNPHGDYAKELVFFVKDVGLTPLEVIKCATKTGAEIMGRSDEFGTLEKGKLADVLVVDGDVVKNISLLTERSKFLAVMQGGEIKAGSLAKPFPTVVSIEK